jgi:hypothetical protein
MASIPFDDRDLEDSLVRILDQAEEPLTVSKLAQRAAENLRKQAKLLDSILARLIDQGRAFRFAPYRSKLPRYWAKDTGHYARGLIVNLITEKGPCSQLDLGKATTSRLKGWPKVELASLLSRLVHDKTLRELPPLGRSKVRRLSLKPPEPREYLEKLFTLQLVKPLSKTIGMLHEAGTDPRTLLEESQAVWRETLATIQPFSTLALEGSQTEHAIVERPRLADTQVATLNGGMPHLPDLTSLIERILGLKPNAAQGAMVALPDLRQIFRDDFPTKEEFDQAILLWSWRAGQGIGRSF